jgi:hypothetical protein
LRAEPFEQEFRLGSGTLGYDFGDVTLTSISSYQTVRSHAITDVSAFFVPALAGLTYTELGHTGRQIDLAAAGVSR